MAVFNSAVLTTRGNELLVDAVAGDRITFTRMVVGCGEYSDRERERSALERMTSLKDIKQEFTFSAYKKVSEQCVLLTAVISNRELDYSYKITEIGIYGKRTEDEADFLCSIAVTKSLEESDTFPPYNGLQECQIVQDYYITISPDAEVSVNTQGACVLREEFELIKQTLSTEISNLKEGKLDKDGDGSNLTVKFEQAKDRKNISSGSKLSIIMGIISKVITDLKAGAFSVVVNHLMATEEGGVLDSRQGKALKDMIDELKRSLDSLTQSFRDGCKMIVDRLTALGYGPAAPQGPEQIVAAINIMYSDRYNVGRIQGRNDVIADPGAYGISTEIKLEQVNVQVSSPTWACQGTQSITHPTHAIISFTAPNDGILIVNNHVFIGLGVSYQSSGHFWGNVEYKGSIISSFDQYSSGESFKYEIIPGATQYHLKAGESLKITGYFSGDADTDYSGGKTHVDNFGCLNCDAITWVHLYV